MGQMVLGVLWGVEVPDDVDMCDGEGDPVVLKQYGALARVKTADEPSNVYDDGLLGFWVVLDRSDEDHVPSFSTATPFEGFAGGPYANSLGRAKKRWEKFTTWASSQGHHFPLPKLWLAQTEVA